MDNKENFIMLPTVDVCFKNLMENPKVRRCFIAALLNIEPEEIGETQLLPTLLPQEYADDKLGILDVRVIMKGYLQKWKQKKVLRNGCVFSVGKVGRISSVCQRKMNT